jgi:hypothetical protein
MMHPRDRYRREPNNICLEITVSLIAAIIMILISIGLVMALTHASSSKNDETKKITSDNSMHNKTVSFKTISLEKQNVTFQPVILETKTVVQNTQKTVPISLIEVGRKGSVTRTSTVESWHSLARKGRYMKRALLKNNKDD